MRWCGCVSGQMRWARLALGKRGKPTLPNPKLGRCWPLTWGIQSLPLLILHLVLASYEQPFPAPGCSLLTLSLILTIVQYLDISPPESSSTSSGWLTTGGDRSQLLRARPSTSSSALSPCNAWICARSVWELFFFRIFGFMHDQCESLRDGERERADPTVPPPQPIWRDRPIHGIRHTQAESTKIPWSAIRWPKKTHKCNSWTSLEAPLRHQVGNCPWRVVGKALCTFGKLSLHSCPLFTEAALHCTGEDWVLLSCAPAVMLIPRVGWAQLTRVWHSPDAM